MPSSRQYILNALLEVLREAPEKSFYARDLAVIISERMGFSVSTIRAARHLGLAENQLLITNSRGELWDGRRCFAKRYRWRAAAP